MGFVAIRRMWRGYRRKMDWQTVDQNVCSYFVTVLDLEILLGLLLWTTQGRWDGANILRSMHHPTLMLAAWAVVRVGWFQVQQSTISDSKFLRASLFFTLGIIVMIIGVAQIYEIF